MTTKLSCAKCGTTNDLKAGYCYLCHDPLAGIPKLGTQALTGSTGEEGGGAPGKPVLRFATMLPFTEAKRYNILMSLILFVALFGLLVLVGAIIGALMGNINHGLAFAVALYAILAGTAYYSGSKIILALHNAGKVDRQKHQQFINVVEEMSIASGLPVPALYVMPTAGMNAFAAGRHPKEAVVAVTQGLLDNLNREELQGVIAHEMAHIKSRDTLYNICAAVLVGAITILSEMVLRAGMHRGRRSSGSRGGGLPAVILIVIGFLLTVLAPMAANILQMSISRQREYHADAAAAEFTRNPMGLASALSKITERGASVPGENRGTQHLFIVNPLSGLGKDTSKLMSTHPETRFRIRRLRAMAGFAEA
ncbi:MAG: M48 family metallopeptidase [Syntrophorhabdaceae bacterium]|nr:M48 family metallopeptidase [Syntrophorhabdaceae bacterium]